MVKRSYLVTTLIILTALPLFLLIMLPVHVTPWADDFVFMERVKDYNIVDYIWSGYMQWDGRYLSLHTVLHYFMIKHFGVVFSVFVWSLFFYLFCLFALLLVEEHQKLTLNFRVFFLKLGLLTLLLWLGFSYHIADTVYWAAGGGYVMSLAMVYGWVYVYRKNGDKSAHLHLIVFFFFSLLTGLVGVIGSFPVLVFLFLDYIFRVRGEKRAYCLKFPLVGFAGVLVGTLLNVLAPGNFIRGSILESSFNFYLPLMLLDGVKITLRYLYFSFPVILASFLWVVFSRIISHPLQDMVFRLYSPRVYLFGVRNSSKKAIVGHTQWFFMAFASIIPMLAIPEFAGGRATIFFMAFLFTGMVLVLQKLVWLHDPKFTPLATIVMKSYHIRVALLLVFIGFTLVLVKHHHCNRQIKNEMVLRQESLQALPGKPYPAVMKPLQIRHIPFSYKIDENMGMERE